MVVSNSLAMGMGVGYAYAYGQVRTHHEIAFDTSTVRFVRVSHAITDAALRSCLWCQLDFLKPSVAKVQSWESGLLANFTGMLGWVPLVRKYIKFSFFALMLSRSFRTCP